MPEPDALTPGLFASALFEDVSPEEVERIIAAGRRRTVDQGNYVYRQGESDCHFYIIAAGEAELTMNIDGGDQFHSVAGRLLPTWAAEIDCANWAQFFLKWVVSHPAVTCAIPATTNPDHLDENMGAGLGRMPDAAMRRRMREYLIRV